MYTARTPGGRSWARCWPAAWPSCPPTGWCSPSPRGYWPRRSNYRRNTFAPAAEAAGWPRRPDGRRAWTFHSLRHVLANWALSRPGARIEDVSRLLGHSTVRVTQDLYISADGDLYQFGPAGDCVGLQAPPVLRPGGSDPKYRWTFTSEIASVPIVKVAT